MGAVNSCWLPRYRNPNMCRENHTSTPKIKGHKRNLSAAFNMAEIEQANVNYEQLNINTATEEELMTLPEINRVTAHNIVEYRRQIGVFKKVEDLALVSGVGATKLNQIRVEICVGRKKSSQSSSRSSSKNDLSSAQDNASSSSKRSQTRSATLGLYPKVNLNTSNVFQLMKVKGISQTIAENIVVHRDKKGPFKSVDDLVKVKGLRHGIVSAIRPHLYLHEDPSTDSEMTPLNTGGASNSSQSCIRTLDKGVETTATNGNVIEPTKTPQLTKSQDDLLSIYGPLVRKSFRKPKHSPVFLKRNSFQVLRIATWNLQQLTSDKAENPGVKEVTCLTILENGFGIVAVQELADPQSLHKICQELNYPTIPNVQRWRGLRGNWKCIVSEVAGVLPQGGAEYLGFLYDASQDINVTKSSLLNSVMSTTKPYIAHFEIGGSELLIVNSHPEVENAPRVMSDVGTEVDRQLAELKPVVLVGHLNLGHGCTSQLEDQGYTILLPSSSALSNLAPPTSILVNRSCLDLHTGACSEVTEGLVSPWIPDGWKWGGRVSNHYPTWAEFYTVPLVEHRELPSSLVSIKLAGPLSGAGDC